MISRHGSSFKKRLISTLLSAAGNPPVRVVLWDGMDVAPEGVVPAGTLRVRDLRTLLKIALSPELNFGDAYSEGRIEVEGDLPALLVAAYRGMSGRRIPWYRSPISRYIQRSQRNTTRGSRRNIHHHYDIGTDFYRLWLDVRLLYTCAYFRNPSDTLEDAQVAKMDHVCRKIGLRPGERVVEAGCGWGALALHMARNYGVSVKAYNISRDQIAYARRRAVEERLEPQVEFIEDDYRNISGKYDVFVSVGMLEHVGTDNYAALGKVIDRSLEANGRGFLHFIGRNRERPLNAWIRKRIFPGAQPPTLRQAMAIFEPFNFAVLDVENLRMHYARTLEHWLTRLEKAAARVQSMYDAEFFRTWRLYLAGSAAAFRAGSLQLFQVAFARANKNDIPWTRAHLYLPVDEGSPEERWSPAIY